MQSKSHSAFEVATNLTVGIIISWAITYLVLPHFGFSPSVAEAGGITLIYTVASAVRCYTIRRIFDGVTRRFVAEHSVNVHNNGARSVREHCSRP